jgi:putative hydrolase of the HAD superfamily
MTAIQYETGRISTEKFLDSLGEIFRHKFTRQQILAAWNAIIEEENSALGPIVNALQARYTTAILSNTSPTHFQKAINASPIVRRLPKRYLSYEIGAMKPDSAAYEHVIHDLKTKPSSILFIDDVSENVIAARESGMEGILFKDASQLGSELRSRKIL